MQDNLTIIPSFKILKGPFLTKLIEMKSTGRKEVIFLLKQMRFSWQCPVHASG